MRQVLAMSLLKFFGGVLLTAALVLFGLVRIAFEIIGASTAPEDFEALKARMPSVLNWLFTTPWWAPTLLFIGLAALAAYLLRSATQEATSEEIEAHPHLSRDEIVELIRQNAPALVTMESGADGYGAQISRLENRVAAIEKEQEAKRGAKIRIEELRQTSKDYDWFKAQAETAADALQDAFEKLHERRERSKDAEFESVREAGDRAVLDAISEWEEKARVVGDATSNNCGLNIDVLDVSSRAIEILTPMPGEPEGLNHEDQIAYRKFRFQREKLRGAVARCGQVIDEEISKNQQVLDR